MNSLLPDKQIRKYHHAWCRDTGKSYTVTLLVQDIADPYFAAIARCIEDKLIKSGYNIFYASTSSDIAKTRGILADLRDRCVDGYMLSAFDGIELAIHDLIKENVPLVLFDNHLVTFDRHDLCKDNNAVMTVLVPPVESIAGQMVSLLLDRMNNNGPATNFRSVLLNDRLVIKKDHIPAKQNLNLN
jgi:DNA-binding LacI/PurR family transcriptional regulator